MTKEPSLGALRQHKSEFIGAFRRWLKLPDRLFREGFEAKKTDRRQMCALLEATWRKLEQDMSGCLSLIGSNHIGPAAALTRICREATLWMAMWAFMDASKDAQLRHYYYDVRLRRNAVRLNKAVGSFLSRPDLGLSDDTIRRLTSAKSEAHEWLTQPDTVQYSGTVNKGDVSFNRLAQITAEAFAQSDLSPDIVAAQVIDYWIECEAVHGGSNALVLYSPDDFGLDIDRNGELTALDRLWGLYPLTVIITSAILRVVGLTGQFHRPVESVELSRIARKAEEMIIDATSDAANRGGG